MRPLLLAILLVSAGVARAEEPPATDADLAPIASFTPPPGLFGKHPGPPLSVRASWERTFRAGFHAYQGGVSIERERISVDTGAPAPDPLLLSLSFDTEISHYDFTGAWGLLAQGDDPAETLLQYGFSPRLLVPLGRFTLFFGGGITFAGAPDAEFEDSLTYGANAGIQILITRDFSILLGFGARTRLEHRPIEVPIVGLDWKISDRIRLRLEQAGLAVDFKVFEGLTIEERASYELREFRLADRGQLPGGILRDERLPVTTNVAWQIVDGFRVEASAGVFVWQQIVLDDHLGRIASRARIDPAAFVSFRIAIDL